MTHRQIQEALAVYADLHLTEKSQVDAHLQTCADCAARLETYRQMDRQLARLPAPRPDERLVPEFYAALAATVGGRRHSFGWIGGWRQLPALAGQVVPLALLVLLVLGMWLSIRQRPFSTAAPIQAVKPTPAPSPTAVPVTEVAATATVIPPPTAPPIPTWAAEMMHTLDGESAILQVALATGGGWLVSGNDQARIQLWRADNGRPQRYWSLPSYQVASLAVSADGRQVAAGSVDYAGYVSLWSTDGRLAAQLEAPQTSVISLAFAPDSTMLAAGTGADDGRVYLWQTADQVLWHTLEVGEGAVTQLAFAANGDRLAVGTASGVVQVWQVADGRLLAQGSWADGSVTALAFSPDGEQLAVAQADGPVRLGPVGAAAPAVVLAEDTAVSALAFNADGSLLATAAADGTVRLWQPGVMPDPLFDTAVSTAVKTPIHLAFAGDQLVVAVGSLDGSLQIWHIDQN